MSLRGTRLLQKAAVKRAKVLTSFQKMSLEEQIQEANSILSTLQNSLNALPESESNSLNILFQTAKEKTTTHPHTLIDAYNTAVNYGNTMALSEDKLPRYILVQTLSRYSEKQNQ